MTLVPVPPAAAGSDVRNEFGAEVIEVLKPMILGADAGKVETPLT